MKLSIGEIEQRLKELNGWSFIDNSIRKTFEYDNFLFAMNFVNNVATLANMANHHPDIDIRYSKVTITLSTHEEGGVTEKDFKLAHKIENIK